MRSRFARPAVVLLVAFAAAGCLGPVDRADELSVELRPARPSGQKLALPPLPAGTILTVARWPDACTLLTDAEITAIVPQARGMTRTPERKDIAYNWLFPRARSFNVSDGRRTTRVRAPDDPRTARDAECRFSMRLPLEERVPADRYNPPSIDVEVLAVAHPRLLADILAARQRSARGFRRLRSQLGADDCFRGGGITCRKGQLLFTVDGIVPSSVKIKGVRDNHEYGAWSDRVLPEVARTVAARVPA